MDSTNIQLQLSARYASPATNLIYHQGSNANISLGLSRKLFHNKGSVGISVATAMKKAVVVKNVWRVTVSFTHHTALLESNC